MTGRPCVSIVTANYNGAQHLAAAARAVMAQSLTDFEWIIVDDCSTDDSLKVIEEATRGDPRVKVIVQPQNGGPAVARNRALDEARGRWIAVFDSDDLMAPDRLERLVARGEADRAGIVVDNLCVFVDGSDAPWKAFLAGPAWRTARWITLADYIASARMYSNRPGLGYLKPLFFADALEGRRYRDDLKIGEDYDLVLRLLVAGCTMRFEPMALYRYRKHAGSISHRMRREHIEQMLAADAELDLASQCAAVRKAQAARRRSLEAAIAYDQVIERLKARDLAGGVTQGLARPDVWPLLTMPVTARVKRLAAKLPMAAAAA